MTNINNDKIMNTLNTNWDEHSPFKIDKNKGIMYFGSESNQILDPNSNIFGVNTNPYYTNVLVNNRDDLYVPSQVSWLDNPIEENRKSDIIENYQTIKLNNSLGISSSIKIENNQLSINNDLLMLGTKTSHENIFNTYNPNSIFIDSSKSELLVGDSKYSTLSYSKGSFSDSIINSNKGLLVVGDFSNKNSVLSLQNDYIKTKRDYLSSSTINEVYVKQSSISLINTAFSGKTLLSDYLPETGIYVPQNDKAYYSVLQGIELESKVSSISTEVSLLNRRFNGLETKVAIYREDTLDSFKDIVDILNRLEKTDSRLEKRLDQMGIQGDQRNLLSWMWNIGMVLKDCGISPDQMMMFLGGI
jgi:hypothetical protein